MWATQCYAVFFVLLALVHSGYFQNQTICGIAGRSSNGRYSPQKTEYEFNEEIRYRCIYKSGLLKGDETRRCLQNGTWSGSVPVCLGKPQSSFLEIIVNATQSVKDLLVNETALWTQPGRTKCTSAYESQNLSIFVRFKNGVFNNIIILDGFELTFPMPSNMTTVRFDCYSSKLSTGISLYFQPDKDEKLSLCHFSPLIMGSCHLPDIPLNGFVQQRIDGKDYEFHCENGFELEGPRSTYCTHENATWAVRSPTCVPKSSLDRQINGTEEVSRIKFGFDLNYVFIGLGYPFVIIVLITIICLIVKRKKRRDSLTTPYYYWSNGIESSSKEEPSLNPSPYQQGFDLPKNVHVPYPLPRDAQSREVILRHLQAEEESRADPKTHYSVVREPGYPENQYLTILDDQADAEKFSEPVYEDCISGEFLVRHSKEIPKPPNTRFSQLGTSGRRLKIKPNLL